MLDAERFIDVVIPCGPQDTRPEQAAHRGVLAECLDGIRKSPQVNRVFTLSENRLTDQVEHIPGRAFPFDAAEIAARHGEKHAQRCCEHLQRLYLPIVMPELSRYVLVLDAESVFTRPVRFLDAHHRLFFDLVDEVPYAPNHDAHLGRLVPGLCQKDVMPLRRCGEPRAGRGHKALLDRIMVASMFEEVQKIHNKPFWEAFVEMVGDHEIFGADGWEIYTSYCFARFPDRVIIRQLKWAQTDDVSQEGHRDDLDYVRPDRTARRRAA